MVEPDPDGSQHYLEHQIDHVDEDERLLPLPVGVGQIGTLEGRRPKRVGHRGTQNALDYVAPLEGRVGVTAEGWQRVGWVTISTAAAAAASIATTTTGTSSAWWGTTLPVAFVGRRRSRRRRGRDWCGYTVRRFLLMIHRRWRYCEKIQHCGN